MQYYCSEQMVQIILKQLSNYKLINNQVMSIIVRPISANLTHDTQFLARMDPYAKIYFGGRLYRTAVCIDGGKNPSWNEVFTFNACSDSTLRVEVWDEDSVKDDLVGAGTYNLMNVYNMNGMRSDNEYIDLYYNGRGAGRILLSFQLQGMNGYWGGQSQAYSQPALNMGYQMTMNTGGWGQPPMNNGGWNQPPTNNGGWGQPPMNSGGWGQPPVNNGWGVNPNPMGNPYQPPMNNNGWNNNGWGF